MSSRQANAMADMVKMERRGFRQIFRHAILTSMDGKTFYLFGFLNADNVKRLLGRSGLKASSL